MNSEKTATVIGAWLWRTAPEGGDITTMEYTPACGGVRSRE